MFNIMRGTNWEKRQDTKAGLYERISNFKRCLLRRRSLIEEFRKKSIRESDNVTPFWLHHRGIFCQRCKKRIARWSLLPANIERWWLTRVNQLSRVQVFISSRGKNVTRNNRHCNPASLYRGRNLWSWTNPRAAFPGINNVAVAAIFLRLQWPRSAIVHTSSITNIHRCFHSQSIHPKYPFVPARNECIMNR